MKPLWEISDYGDDDVRLMPYGDLEMKQVGGWAPVNAVASHKRPTWLAEEAGRTFKTLFGGLATHFRAPNGDVVRMIRRPEHGYLTVWWDVLEISEAA